MSTINISDFESMKSSSEAMKVVSMGNYEDDEVGELSHIPAEDNHALIVNINTDEYPAYDEEDQFYTDLYEDTYPNDIPMEEMGYDSDEYTIAYLKPLDIEAKENDGKANVEVLMKDHNNCSFSEGETDTEFVSGNGETTIIIECGDMRLDKDPGHVVLFYNNFAAEDDQMKNMGAILQDIPTYMQTTAQQNSEQEQADRTCDLCNHVVFPDHEKFIEHVHQYHPILQCPVSLKFKCPFCEYMSKNRTSVRQHVRTHTKEKPYKCGRCDKAFSQKAGVQQHMRSHSLDKPFKCKQCNKSFKAQNTLVTHVSMTHDKLRPYKCEECDLRFGHSSNLRIHMRTHTKQRPFMCIHCRKTFVQQGHLNTHMRMHTGERPFECEYCNAKFTHVGNLRQHRITQHTKEYPHFCKKCSKGFIAPGDFKRHQKLHDQNLI